MFEQAFKTCWQKCLKVQTRNDIYWSTCKGQSRYLQLSLNQLKT